MQRKREREKEKTFVRNLDIGREICMSNIITKICFATFDSLNRRIYRVFVFHTFFFTNKDDGLIKGTINKQVTKYTR